MEDIDECNGELWRLKFSILERVIYTNDRMVGSCIST